MASASLLRVRSFEPAPQSSNTLRRWYAGSALLLSASLFGFGTRYVTGGIAVAAVMLSIAAALGLWLLHMRSGGLRWIWAGAYSFLIAGQLLSTILRHLDIPGFTWFAALGCGAFVYALVWVASMHEQNAGLQAIATIALLLSLGVVSKPALAIACLLISGGLFIANRRSFGGFLGSALLFFTPTLLCFAAILVVNFLTSGTLISHIANDPTHKSIPNSGLPLLSQAAPMLWFALCVLLVRACERKVGIPDFSYILTLVFASTVGIAPWMPDALSGVDILLIGYTGSACLLALKPPQKAVGRIAVLIGASLPLIRMFF